MRFSQCSQDRVQQRVDADFDWDFLQYIRERKAMVGQASVPLSETVTPQKWR